MPAVNIKKITRRGNVYLQHNPGGASVHLGTTVEPVRFVEAGTLKGSVPRRPLTCSIEISQEVVAAMKRLDVTIARWAERLERQETVSEMLALLFCQLGGVAEHIERRRLWPRWAALFTLLMATVAICL